MFTEEIKQQTAKPPTISRFAMLTDAIENAGTE